MHPLDWIYSRIWSVQYPWSSGLCLFLTGYMKHLEKPCSMPYICQLSKSWHEKRHDGCFLPAEQAKNRGKHLKPPLKWHYSLHWWITPLSLRPRIATGKTSRDENEGQLGRRKLGILGRLIDASHTRISILLASYYNINWIILTVSERRLKRNQKSWDVNYFLLQEYWDVKSSSHGAVVEPEPRTKTTYHKTDVLSTQMS